jgi:hypothetical protein
MPPMLKRFTLITVAISLFSIVAPVFGPPMLNELSNPGSAIDHIRSINIRSRQMA